MKLTIHVQKIQSQTASKQYNKVSSRETKHIAVKSGHVCSFNMALIRDSVVFLSSHRKLNQEFGNTWTRAAGEIFPAELFDFFQTFTSVAVLVARQKHEYYVFVFENISLSTIKI